MYRIDVILLIYNFNALMKNNFSLKKQVLHDDRNNNKLDKFNFLLFKELDNTLLVIGDKNRIYILFNDNKIKTYSLSLCKFEKSCQYFRGDVNFLLRINGFTIINTKYYISIHNKKNREIILKNGLIFKVSRSNWSYFI